jgi:hypothetical protein
MLINTLRELKHMTPKAIEKLNASTILVTGIASDLIHCTAREAFDFNGQCIAAQQQFFMVRSSKDATRYYIVSFSNVRHDWQCSCGAGSHAHAHIQTVKSWVIEHVVKPREQEILAKAEPVQTEQLVEAGDDEIEAMLADLEKEEAAMVRPLPRAAEVLTRQIRSSAQPNDIQVKGHLTKKTGYGYLERGIPMR